MDADQARERFEGSPVLRLATADADGRPHIVPCTFAVDDLGQVLIGIDNKPKSTTRLRRLRNIEQNPQVSLLADRYADDWTRLWWARADGRATIERSGAEYSAHWQLLLAKYPQYEGQQLDGPVIVVAVEAWSGWAFGPNA
ncbi:MAG TPA: TIGR03668 family PPOX class F420-dependent oxidoreductase [Streptosporangiaceae bacterium]